MSWFTTVQFKRTDIRILVRVSRLHLHKCNQRKAGKLLRLKCWKQRRIERPRCGLFYSDKPMADDKKSSVRNITITGNTFTGGKTGISMDGVDGAVVDGNIFNDVPIPMDIKNSRNVDVKNNRLSNAKFSASKASETSYYLPLRRGPLRGSSSRPIPATCSSAKCQHAYLSGIRLQSSTRIAIKRNQAGYCPLCGADGYTLDGVYNQVAEQFTAMLYDGITKNQLQDMKNVLGLAIENGDFSRLKPELEKTHRNWKNIFGKLEGEQTVQAVTFYLAILAVMISLHDSVKPYLTGDEKEAQNTVIIQECVNCVVSDDLNQLRSDLLGNTQPPKSEKSSDEKSDP